MFVTAAFALGSSASIPEQLTVFRREALSPADTVVAVTLQGLTAKRSPRIWIDTPGVQAEILADLQREGTRVETGGDIWTTVSALRREIRGIIVYRLGTPSLSVANGLCGPLRAIAVDESRVESARRLGLPVLMDVRGLREIEAWDRFRRLYRPGVVVDQLLDKPSHLRDYAVKHNAFVMDAPYREFRREVVRGSGRAPLLVGWGRDEYGWVEDVSFAGGTGVPADWATNLSVLESLPLRRQEPSRRPLPKPLTPEPNVKYVAFVMSDGDNVQWMTNDFVRSRSFYGSPRRGEFPMSWEVSPLLGSLAPRVLAKIYASATPNDDFVAGPGLPGYEFPHMQANGRALARASVRFLRSSGLRTASFLNANEGALSEVDPWLQLCELDGALYKDYAPYHRRRGETRWVGDKPIVAYRFLLWENLMGVDDLLAEIAKMPAVGDRFAFVNVHAWSYGKLGGPLEAVHQVVTKLPKDVRVVTATQLLAIMRREHANSAHGAPGSGRSSR